jgi:hypothetical protein
MRSRLVIDGVDGMKWELAIVAATAAVARSGRRAEVAQTGLKVNGVVTGGVGVADSDGTVTDVRDEIWAFDLVTRPR